ncbi:MAG: zf-HC2 domain-containing protein [Bryobacterales bacterium]|nr:zf-HC2 domain-containing protein [Bryobacterales bacterium]
MNSLHVDDERIVRYADGELGPKDAARVRAHLESCWECRAELDNIHRAVGECVRYRKALRDVLPAPPRPWQDLQPHFAEIDSSLAQTSFLSRLAGILTPVRLVPLAAAAAALLVIVYTNRELPTVSAAEVLKKAVAAEQSRPQQLRRYQIKSRGARLTDPATIRRLETVAVAANYDWSAPLSARSFSRWHDSLADKQDAVFTTANYYTVSTRSQASEIVEASLQLRTADYVPTATSLEFRNHDRIDITELPAEAAIAHSAGPVEPSRGVQPPLTEVKPLAGTTPADELKVFAALRKLGADLGEPIEISRTADAVVVTVLGVDPSRRQQLQSGLASLSRVDLRFPELPAPPTVSTWRNLSRSTVTSPFEGDLNQYFGGRAAVDRFTDQTLELIDSAVARAHALRRLTEHFPPQVVATLPSDDRAEFQNLYADHATALAQSARQLNQLTNPVLTTLKAPPVSAGTGAATPAELLDSARTVEQLFAAVLTGATTDVAVAELPVRLRFALTQLMNSADFSAASPPQ